MTIEFSRQILKNPLATNFMKIRLVGAELFHADGRTEGRTDRRTNVIKLVVAFRKFANAPKIL
jgi:hypothetical protein